MDIGSVVIVHPGTWRWRPEQRPVLACGTGIYTHAICVSVDPFVLVSEEADMLWEGQERLHFLSLCKADKKIIKRCMKRYKRTRSSIGQSISFLN